MPLPAGVDGVTVSSGKPLTLPDGTPIQGKLLFAGPDVVTVAGQEVLLGGTTEAKLVDGAFSVTLAANDVTGMSPSGWTYRVTAAFTNAPGWVRYIALSKAAPSVTLAQVIVPDPAEANYIPVVGPQGPPGPQGATGPVGPQPPLGAAGAGDTVALKSTDPTTTNARTPLPHHATHEPGGSDALTGYVPSSGGTVTGDVTFVGGRLVLNVVPGSPTTNSSSVYALHVVSSYDGGEDTFDSTGRLVLESYQRAQQNNTSGVYASYGEVLRIYSRRWDSKQMIAWYGPTSYNGDGTPATSDTAWFWMGAHYEANDHASVHGHWSIEVPDTSNNLQTRFEFRIWDPTTGVFGMDRTIAKFNAADVLVEQSNGAFYLAAAAGTAKNAYFTNDTTVVSGASATGKRWGLQADGTAETGSNVGTDWRLNRYNDSGVFIESALFVRRSNGQVGIGGLTNPAAKLDVTAAGSYHTVQAAQTTTGSVVYAAYSGILGSAANKLFDGRVLNDATGRVALYTDRIELGDGTNNRDAFIRRVGAGTIGTDGALTVGTTLAVTGTATVNGQPVGQNLFAKKTANEVVNNSSTVQDDDHLTVTVAANAVYEMTALFIYDGTSTADMKAGFVAPSGSTLDWVTQSLDAGAGSGITGVKMTAQTISGFPSFGAVGAGSKVIGRVSGLLTVGVSGGTFKVQWAQNTAEATDTTMYTGSYLSLRRIS